MFGAPHDSQIKVPIAIFIFIGFYDLITSKTIPKNSLLSKPPISQAIPTLLMLSLPHLLYFFIWNWPKSFKSIAKSVSSDHPVDFMFKLVSLGKLIQFTTIFIWYLKSIKTSIFGRITEIVTLKSLGLLQLMAGIGLVFIGQFINSFVWKKLGIDGTCYGFKLGRPIEWVTGFPFNIGLRHPQYVASCLTLIGLTFLLIDKDSAQNGMIFIVSIWCGFYLLSAITEEISDMDKSK